MNFQQLEYVLAVYQERNFRAAADVCDISQATLSAMIKKLEVEIGYTLFDRKHQPIKITEVGAPFIEKAKHILQLKRELYHLSDDEETLQGTLRIGVIPTIASSLLPSLLKKIIIQFPQLNLECLEITTEEIKQQLSADKIDLGILATPINDQQFQEDILYYEAMMVYGVQDPSKQYISSADVKNESIWLLEEGHCFREQSLTVCELRGKEQHDAFEFLGSTFETLLNLTDALGGFTLIPELYYQLLSEKRKAKCRYFQNPTPVREISLLSYRPESHRNSIKKFKSIIQELLKFKLSTNKIPKKELEIIGI